MPSHLSQIQSTWILVVGEILGSLETTLPRICNELPCKEGVGNFYLGQGCKQHTTCRLHCIMCGGIQAWLVVIHIVIKWSVAVGLGKSLCLYCMYNYTI